MTGGRSGNIRFTNEIPENGRSIGIVNDFNKSPVSL